MSQKTPPRARLIKECETAEILGVKVSTLRRWRWAGRGPAFCKLGAAVRYEPEVIAAYIAANRRQSTSDTGSAIA